MDTCGNIKFIKLSFTVNQLDEISSVTPSLKVALGNTNKNLFGDPQKCFLKENLAQVLFLTIY